MTKSHVLHTILALALLFFLASCKGQGTKIRFTHGIGSGDVSENAVVLWTRVNREAEVAVEVSSDCSFEQIDREAKSIASNENDFTIKVVVGDLDSGTNYCYRFSAGTSLSDTGSFRTAPGWDENAAVSFAYSSDSDGSKEPSFNDFEVLDQVRMEDVDFWVYLGDTAYMDTFGGKAETVEDMRAKYKQNRGFTALGDLLKSTSTYAVWDDHEVENDYDGETVDPVLYANGRSVFLEYMPASEPDPLNDPDCVDDPMFRLFHWGKNVDLIILDERSCRSASVEDECQDDVAPTLPANVRESLNLTTMPPPGCLDAINDPTRTMLGEKQKEALKVTLLESNATWKIIINEVSIGEVFGLPYDRWEGYAAERMEILDFIASNNLKNVVFLTGDLHANIIGDVLLNAFTDPLPVVKEVIAGPISQETLFGRLAEVLGFDELALMLLSELIGITDPQCVNADAFAYALIEADGESLTVTLKDDRGMQIEDQLNRPGSSCTITIPAQ